jgi:hypothetical protein
MALESAAMTAGSETPNQAAARDNAATFPLSVHDGANEVSLAQNTISLTVDTLKVVNRRYSENNIATPPASPAREVLHPTVSTHFQMANSIGNKPKISVSSIYP